MKPDTRNWLKNVAGLALSHEETVFTSYEMAASVLDHGIPGDLVECGVFAGAQAFAMARAIMDAPEPRLEPFPVVHLFDSFQGIPVPGPEDHELLQSGNEPGSAKCSLEQVQGYAELFKIPAGLLQYHPGWFQDTVPDPLAVGAIALLRLDGDLYTSTKLCMTHLYPKLSRGGWLIVDDYHLSGCRKAIDEAGIQNPCYFQKL